jgi:branched-subunit amino acid transport protein
MNSYLVILVAGLGCYVLRMSMIGTDRVRLPARFDSSVALVAPAAFTALAVTTLAGILLDAGLAAGVNVHTVVATVPALLAIAAGMGVVFWTGKPFFAVLAGMPTFWLATALLSI